MINIMKKRAYDMSCCTNKANIYFNGDKIKCNNFEKYINYYIGNKDESSRAFEIFNEKWEIGVSLSKNEMFESISFVNGINTIKGGKHVDYITNQITKKLADLIQKRKKTTVKQNVIKENLFLIIKSVINNPTFDKSLVDICI